MKRAVSIFLFILLTFSIFLKLGIVIQWKINQEYIAKNLCVNIEKPQMGCRGKCQLDKRLQKADTESKQDKPSSAQKIASIDVFLPAKKIEPSFLNFQESNSPFYFYTDNQYTYCFLSSDFRPPASIV